MNCAETLGLLHGYVDNELDPVRAADIERHLQTCAACSTACEQQRSLRSAVRSHGPYFRASDSLRRRVHSLTTGAKPEPRVKPAWAWFRLGGAAAFAALITWAVTYQALVPSQVERVADEAIANHARALMANHLADVASSDQHTVKPWLSSRLDFSPPVMDLTGQGFPLVGGRLDYLDGHPAAALVYRHRQHVINLFVWPGKQTKTVPAKTLSKRGYNLLTWAAAGMEFWAISDLNLSEMQAFADTFTAQMNP